jgi:sulfite reductase (NADPH) hemoprotein beta-component
MSEHSNGELGRADLRFSDEGDVDRFVSTLARFENGEIDADAWRAFRLVHGTYGQRQEGTASMLRVKIPQGILTADQARVVADVTARHSRGFSHVTTRQNVQMHFVELSRVGEAMRELAAAGLTTREACGNAVRNVTTSVTAGIAADEVFDPVPYARAFTRHLLRHPLASTLPRKFKVAFSGGGADHSFVTINDIGFFARVRDGRRGFRVTVAGGTATMVASGRELFAFLPADEIFAVGVALLELFHAKGDRVHRHKNRLKFLVKQIGWDAFRSDFEARFAEARAREPELPFAADAPPEEVPARGRASKPTSAEIAAIVADDPMRPTGIAPRFVPMLDAGFERFAKTNVAPQRQAGFAWVTVTVPLGDLSSGRWRALARLAEGYGDGLLRATPTQNVVLAWVRTDDVPELYRRLAAIGLARTDPTSLADVGSCPGAESCKLAVTQSRGLADLLNDAFRARRDWLDLAEGLELRVSGCPNGCGLHHVAGLGFQGGMRKVGGKAVPQYFIYVGGDAGGDFARFGRLAAKVPARRVPRAVERLLELYVEERREGESATAFFGRVEVARVKLALGDLERLDEASATLDDFVDLGETVPFVADAKEGECAA